MGNSDGCERDDRAAAKLAAEAIDERTFFLETRFRHYLFVFPQRSCYWIYQTDNLYKKTKKWVEGGLALTDSV